MLLEISGEITPKRKKGWNQSITNTQLWMGLVIEARSDAVKSNIAYEPGMSGPWIKANWKWSNKRWQGWMSTFSELKWTGMGEFNSDDHYIYYWQESLRRNGVAIMVIKRVQNAVLGCNRKNDRMISIRLQGKPFNITVIQVYAPAVMIKKLKLKDSMKT